MNFDRLKQYCGIIKVILDRQRGYLNYLTWLFLAGLYSDKIKYAIVLFAKEYWYAVLIAWLVFAWFDVKVIYPGERSYHDRKSSVLAKILEQGKKQGN